MQKNIALFLVLTVLTFVGWGWYMHKYYPVQPPKPVAKVVGSTAASAVAAVGITPSVTVASTAALPAAPKHTASAKEERVTIKTDKLEVVFSSLGAKIVSWKLLPYREHKDSPNPVQLIPDNASFNNFGGLDVLGADLENAAWTLESSKPKLEADGTQVLSFSTRLGGQVLIRKTFVLSKDDFLATIKLDFINQSSKSLKLSKAYLLWGPGLGQPESSHSRGSVIQSVVQLDKKVERENASNDDKVFDYDAPKWVAQKNHYFVAAYLPEGNDFPEAQTRRYKDKTLSTALGAGELVLKPGETRSLATRLYAGPQIYEKLQSFGMNLESVVQFEFYSIFEWLNPLSVGMLHVMRWFYALTGNWGVAIVLLTALVRGVLFYPSQKSMVSMRKMQVKMKAMKPRLDAIKKIHKDDSQKLNAETMALYKEFGVNPLGGCLPMLLQIPVFFSLYGTLLAAFEIRGAPFFWKWDDLSGPDHTKIFALFMGATMFLQQYMSPTNTSMADDQAQTQKVMMYMMPIMFTVMAIMFDWPMGLLLYWSVSNVFGILQQYYVNKTVTS